MSWWCSADGRAWTWEWRPYLGAWLLVGTLVALYTWAYRKDPGFPLRRKLSAVLGILLVLVATDWPMASLGAGYLLSVQMGRQVIVVLIAIPLLLYGAPPVLGRWLDATDRRRAVIRAVTHPVVAVLTTSGLLLLVNTPMVSDRTITSPLGSFAIDALWILAGVILWLPVQPPSPMRPRLVGPLALIYLFIQSIAPLPTSFFMTWAEYPLFATFELAPRVVDSFSAVDDQELASGIAQVIGGMIIWIQIAARFLHWAVERERAENATIPHFIRQAEEREARRAARGATPTEPAGPVLSETGTRDAP